jgi:hypothetical protein
MEGRVSWHAWSQALDRRGLRRLTAAVLHAAGPLSFPISQLAVFSQPFFGSLLPESQWQAVIGLLSDANEGCAFAAFLNEEDDR